MTKDRTESAYQAAIEAALNVELGIETRPATNRQPRHQQGMVAREMADRFAVLD